MGKLIKVVGVLVGIGAIAGVAVVALDSKAAQLREDLTLDTKPSGSVTIENAREQIESNSNVVLTVCVGAKDIPKVWLDGTASFYVGEATPGSHYCADGSHDPQACAFCRHKWKPENAAALVHLTDKSGKRIDMNAGELLGLTKGDVIVVQGTGSLDAHGLLIVESNGLFIQN